MTTLNDQVYPRFTEYEVGSTASTGPFAVTFPYYDEDTVDVNIDGVNTTAFDVQTGSPGTAENNYVVLHAAVANATVTVFSNTNPIRTLDVRFVASELSIEIDRVFALFQEHAQLLAGINSDLDIIIGDPDNGNYNDILERLTEAERLLAEIEALLEALTARVTTNEEDIGDIATEVARVEAETLAAAQAAQATADQAAADILAERAAREAEIEQLQTDVEYEQEQTRTEVDNLRWRVDNWEEGLIGFLKVLDEVTDGAPGAAVNVQQGPAALGYDGTVVIESTGVAPDTSGQGNGFSITVPSDKSKFLGAQQIRIAVLATRAAVNSGDKLYASYGKPNDTPPYASNVIELTHTTGFADHNWRWFVGYFDAPAINSGGPDYVTLYGDVDQPNTWISVVQVMVEPKTGATEIAEIDALWAEIDRVETAYIAGDAAVAQSVLDLESKVLNVDGTEVNASIMSSYYTIANADTAIATADAALKVAIEDPAGDSIGATLNTDYYTIVQNENDQDPRSAAGMDLALKTLIEDPEGESVGGKLEDYINSATDPNGALVTATRSLETAISTGSIAAAPDTNSARRYFGIDQGSLRPSDEAEYDGTWAVNEADGYFGSANVPGASGDGETVFSRSVVQCQQDDVIAIRAQVTQRSNAQAVSLGYQLKARFLDKDYNFITTKNRTFDATTESLQTLETDSTPTPPDGDTTNPITAPANAAYVRFGFRLMDNGGGWADPKPAEIALVSWELRNITDYWSIGSEYELFQYSQTEWNEVQVGRIETLELNIGNPADDSGVYGEIKDIHDLKGTVDGTVLGIMSDELLTYAGKDKDYSTAFVDHLSATKSTVDGSEAGIMMRIGAGNKISLLDMFVMKDGINSPAKSVAHLQADDILLNGSVTGKSVAITEGWGNMIPNGSFVWGDFRAMSGFNPNDPTRVKNGRWYIVKTSSGGNSNAQKTSPYKYNVYMKPAGGFVSANLTDHLPAEPGRGYRIKFGYAASGATRSRRIGIRVSWYNAAGNIISNKHVQVNATSINWAVRNARVVAPSGVKTMIVRLYDKGDTDGGAWVSGVECVKEQKGSTFIEDGTVTTDTILANTIVAGNIIEDGLHNVVSASNDSTKYLQNTKADEAFLSDGNMTTVASVRMTTKRNTPAMCSFRCNFQLDADTSKTMWLKIGFSAQRVNTDGSLGNLVRKGGYYLYRLSDDSTHQFPIHIEHPYFGLNKNVRYKFTVWASAYRSKGGNGKMWDRSIGFYSEGKR